MALGQPLYPTLENEPKITTFAQEIHNSINFYKNKKAGPKSRTMTLSDNFDYGINFLLRGWQYLHDTTYP